MPNPPRVQINPITDNKGEKSANFNKIFIRKRQRNRTIE